MLVLGIHGEVISHSFRKKRPCERQHDSFIESEVPVCGVGAGGDAGLFLTTCSRPLQHRVIEKTEFLGPGISSQ